jgi:hypothetical protein
MVFADRLAENTRAVLQERGWGWLDRRRGNLRIWSPGVRIDTTIAPTSAPEPGGRVRDPFSAAGRRLALWLLLHPHDVASPRAISRELGVSAGQISNLLRALADDALLRRDKTPLVPELFWALAEHWKQRRHALLSMPPQAELAAAPELQTRQWVGDTHAMQGAGRVFEAPAGLYVPDRGTHLAAQPLVAPDCAQRVARGGGARPTRVRPGSVCDPRAVAAGTVVVALVAVDRNRGLRSSRRGTRITLGGQVW